VTRFKSKFHPQTPQNGPLGDLSENRKRGIFSGKNKEIGLKTEFITSSPSTFLRFGVCMSLIAYGSFNYPPGEELHPMEAALESGCAVRFNRYRLDRIPKLPAQVVVEISVYGFFLPFNGVSRNHTCGHTAVCRATRRPLSL
jgi:hypothetical protein